MIWHRWVNYIAVVQQYYMSAKHECKMPNWMIFSFDAIKNVLHAQNAQNCAEGGTIHMDPVTDMGNPIFR